MAAPKPGAGQLIELVSWQKRVPVSDGYGNTEGEFLEQFTTRAGYTWMKGGEAVIAARMEGKQPIGVRVRRNDQTTLIRPDWRMVDVDSGMIYAVHAITRSAERGYLDVLVEQGVAA